MKIGIHHYKGSYSDHWIKYCDEQGIPYKIVDCYNNNIINDLEDCELLMWHFSHSNPKDALFAKELIRSVEAAGKVVYPDSRSCWHFDDKLGQKYLLESLKLPLIPTQAFFSRKDALNWISTAEFPIIFKLRTGAGGRNVMLIRNKRKARGIVFKAFSKGIRQYNAIDGIKDKIRLYKLGLTSKKEVLKAFAHIVYPIQLEKSKGREKGYVYFQKFIPNNTSDIRVQLVGNNSWAMIRKVRKNDFRASGSGQIDFDMGKSVPPSAVEFALQVARTLNMQSLALDLLPFNNSYVITEISYAFGIDPEELEVGYWDGELKWHPGKINPFGWMVENLIQQYNAKRY